MKTNKQKWIGVFIMFLSLITCFFFLWFFKLDGIVIDYKNTSLLLKMVFATSLLPIGLYLGLYFCHSKKLAIQIGWGSALFLATSFIFGYIRELINPVFKPIFSSVVILVVFFFMGYFSQNPRSIKTGLKLVLVILIISLLGYLLN